jgi:hypothetical protein
LASLNHFTVPCSIDIPISVLNFGMRKNPCG